MADALISILIEQLASIVFEQIKSNVRLILDVEKEVDEFTEHLITIQAVLKDAEKRQVTEAVVQRWLDMLKEVAYEMDNVLDEWNSQALKQQIEEQEKGENALVIKKKVCFSIFSPSNCFCFGHGSREIVVSHDIAQTIKDLNIRLTSIAEERFRYQFQYITTGGIEQPPPKTSYLVNVFEIFGWENEKRTLISMLLAEEGRGPLVISIVGMGGMGKTTLAQLAYNDENVKAHFEKRRWVCVSDPFDDPFDEIKIAKTIIGEDDSPITNELDALMQSLSKSVEGKRFLLVLDDVWTEDDTKWKQLKLALMSGTKDSRILVTTRKETVARMMRGTTHMIHLKKLSEENCSSLFYRIAFFDRVTDKIDSFKAIGNKIVKKCNGLPLAVKCFGYLMRYKNTLQEWQNVLNSEMWEIREVEENVFRPLLLSYYELTSEVKRCLLFCASFPKNYAIDKEILIELWMSQNYLNSKRNKGKRAIGQQYFDDLVMRFFFQDFQNDSNGNLRWCKMHDMVHDFLRFLTRNECLIFEANDGNPATVLSSYSVHHLTLMLAAKGRLSLPTPFHSSKKLRSLTIFNRERVTIIDGDLILQLKCLRALNLSRSGVKEVPKDIGELLHLRYIDLSDNRSLKELPDAMCNLCNLETLHLERCRSLEKLPKAMGKLINLKHLYVDCCTRLRCLPKELGRLTGLRILDQYKVVCGGDENEILELGDLGSFEKLQGKLEIANLGNVKDVREAQKAQLEKKHLLELIIDFGHSGSREQQQIISDEEVLNGLRPHQDLKYLWVNYYQGTAVPGNWMMSLQHLTRLTLIGFQNCESLSPLGKLPYLEVLSIGIMRSVKKIGVEFLGIEETHTSLATATAFPKLEKLSFIDMGGWEEWEGVGDDCQVTIMPCLSSLWIWGAPKLKQLPDFLHNRPRLNSRLVTEPCEVPHQLVAVLHSTAMRGTPPFCTTFSGNTASTLLGDQTTLKQKGFRTDQPELSSL